MKTVEIGDQVRCVRRERELRKRLYPGWVAQGKLGAGAANLGLSQMEAVLQTLERLQYEAMAKPSDASPL